MVAKARNLYSTFKQINKKIQTRESHCSWNRIPVGRRHSLHDLLSERQRWLCVYFDCNFVAFYVDGQSFPTKPLQPNYQSHTYLEAYQTLVSGIENVYVEREEYLKGNALYVLDINPYIDFNTKRRGHCRLELKFAFPLSESATLILYEKFPQILHTDQSRSIIFKWITFN